MHRLFFDLRNHPSQNTGGREGSLSILKCETYVISFFNNLLEVVSKPSIGLKVEAD